MRYRVSVVGCDDQTDITIELTDAEAAAVEHVAEAITAASAYPCQPVMNVAEAGA